VSDFPVYLHDDKASANAIDEDGFFKTGDIGRREGEWFYILGRASVDIIKSGGYKLSALDIEREILGLNYVAEVAVVGKEDEEWPACRGCRCSERGGSASAYPHTTTTPSRLARRSQQLQTPNLAESGQRNPQERDGEGGEEISG
jgi:acyl-CoA synthetase (AMP-forming)/AMP-acid ligase II